MGALRRRLPGALGIPNRAFAYFLAQTLVGVGPVEDRERLHAYAEKAMREASQETGWTSVDEGYESTVQAAIDLAYDDAGLRDAWQRLLALVEQPGWSNALGQKLVQLTMPGHPRRLPGHRAVGGLAGRPRQPSACRLRPAPRSARLVSAAPPVDASGAAKLWVTTTALRLRRDRPELFTGYAPVPVSGPASPTRSRTTGAVP